MEVEVLDDGWGNDGQGETHAFTPLHGGMEAKVSDVHAHVTCPGC